jgi:hypothetical protein
MIFGSFLGVLFLGLLFLFGLSDTDKEFLGAFWNVAKRYMPARLRHRFDRG